jgi:hypothetical protein
MPRKLAQYELRSGQHQASEGATIGAVDASPIFLRRVSAKANPDASLKAPQTGTAALHQEVKREEQGLLEGGLSDLEVEEPIVLTLCMGSKCNTTANLLASRRGEFAVFKGVVLANCHRDISGCRNHGSKRAAFGPQRQGNKSVLPTRLLMLAPGGTDMVSSLLHPFLGQPSGSIPAQLSVPWAPALVVLPAHASSVHSERGLITKALSSQALGISLVQGVLQNPRAFAAAGWLSSIAVVVPSTERGCQCWRCDALVAANATAAIAVEPALKHQQFRHGHVGTQRRTEEHWRLRADSVPEQSKISRSVVESRDGKKQQDIECPLKHRRVSALQGTERASISGSSERLEAELSKELVEILLRWRPRNASKTKDKLVWVPSVVKASSFDRAVLEWLQTG